MSILFNWEGKPYKSIIDAMDGQRIFSVSEKDGKFEIVEECDSYFSVSLTPAELRRLGEELIEMSKTIEEPKP